MGGDLRETRHEAPAVVLSEGLHEGPLTSPAALSACTLSACWLPDVELLSCSLGVINSEVKDNGSTSWLSAGFRLLPASMWVLGIGGVPAVQPRGGVPAPLPDGGVPAVQPDGSVPAIHADGGAAAGHAAGGAACAAGAAAGAASSCCFDSGSVA